MNEKRHVVSAAIGGVHRFGFGLAFEVCCWLALTDDIFSLSTPRFLGLFFALLGAVEPLRTRQST